VDYYQLKSYFLAIIEICFHHNQTTFFDKHIHRPAPTQSYFLYMQKKQTGESLTLFISVFFNKKKIKR